MRKLNVPAGMNHFIKMIVMTNLAIYTIALPLQKAVPCRTKFLTKSHWVIYKKKKKSKNYNENERNEREGQK